MATTHQSNGPIDPADIGEWKQRFNDVLARPGEHLNSASPDSARSWHNAFFGCFNPIDTCLVTWCLPCVTFGKTHYRLRKDSNLGGYEPVNTSCLLFCGSTCFGLHWIPIALQRADIREKYQLQGNCIVDIASACCCGCCDLIQQEKESAHWESQSTDTAGYKTNQEMIVPEPITQ